MGRFSKQFVPESLMVALKMVVFNVLADDGSKMPFVKRHDAMKALGFDRTDEPLSIGVQIRTSGWQSHRADSTRHQHGAKRLGEEWIAIHDEVTSVVKETTDVVSQISRDLLHPSVVRLVGDAGDVDAPGLQIDDEQDEVSNESALP